MSIHPQTSILENIISPGEMPIFIVAPEMERGMKLALLLSANVNASKPFSRIYQDITIHNNYFYNKNLGNILRGARLSGFANPAEERSKLKLLLEESFENGKLWGLQCSYEHFFKLELFNLYKEAFYIFIYDEPLKLNTSDLPFLKQMEDFSNSNADDCILIQTKSLQHIPNIILPRLPFEYHNEQLILTFSGVDEMYDEDKETDLGDDDLLKKKIHQPITTDAQTISLFHKLNEINVFSRNHSRLVGVDSLIILRYEGDIYKPVLIEKLEDIKDTFLQLPEIQIICNNEQDKAEIASLLNNAGYTDFTILVCGDNNGISSINSVISNCKKQIIVVDGLHFNTRFSDMLIPFDQNGSSPAIVFGKISGRDELHKAKTTQADILTTHIIQNTLSFPKTLWQKVNGFDANLNETVYLWDFLINAVQETNGKVMSIEAHASEKQEKAEHHEVTQKLHSQVYQKVIAKNRHIFESNFFSLLESLSDQQHLPQYEIKELHHKISNLQSLLKHSKNELRAVTDLTRALQHRIKSFEDHWYYRFTAKIKKVKKIFFKKNTGGTGRLKKILNFLAFTFSKPGFKIIRKIAKNGLKKIYLIAEDRPVKITYLDEEGNGDIVTYNDWIKFRQDAEKIRKGYVEEIANLSNQPKISIVMPVYNPPLNYLKQAIESVLKQDYRNWELCMADDCSPGDKVRKILNAYTLKDNRIKVHYRTENGHISASSNDALAMATGEYVLFMDHDDLLSLDCLFEVIKHINEHPENDIIYSDEDKIDENNKHTYPHFKPDWAPHSLLSRNYFGHVVVMRKRIIDEIKGFRLGFEGSQDYDLMLRATEATQHVGHIPKVLYHWRIHGKSAAHSEEVKPYAYIAAKKALEEALERRQTPGKVSYLSGLRGYRISYEIKSEDKVSIIIPTKDQVKLLKNTIDSILHRTDYTNHEIIILNNNSTSKEFFSLMADYSAKYPEKFRCIDANFPFNFSKLMNIGAAAATGKYLLLLNNDVEVIHEDWLQRMVAYAQQNEIGAVGVKLLYPDDHIQHAGVIVGLGGVAGHVFVNAFKDDAGYFNYIQSVNNFSAVTAACLMCRKSVYDQVGGMNEELEVEYNDVDICLKFLEAGYYNVYIPDVELYHYESATRGHPHQSRESWNRHVREIKLFKARWQKYIDHDPYFNPNLNIGAHDFSMNFSTNMNAKISS